MPHLARFVRRADRFDHRTDAKHHDGADVLEELEAPGADAVDGGKGVRSSHLGQALRVLNSFSGAHRRTSRPRPREPPRVA